MTTATLTPPPRRGVPPTRLPRGPRTSAAGDLAFAGAPLLVVAAATWGLLGLPASYLLESAGLYAATVALILRALPLRLPGSGLGPANRVTLGRATLVLPIAALTLHPAVLEAPGARWWVILLATVALILDGVDGRTARRTGTETPFGARFDMELDAFLLLALSVLVWRSGQAGPWVILIGAIRYGFVAAAALWPWLDGSLPPSMRRKTVCVVQGLALVLCLTPFLGSVLATSVAGGALAMLVYSFAVDVRWLAAMGSGLGLRAAFESEPG